MEELQKRGHEAVVFGRAHRSEECGAHCGASYCEGRCPSPTAIGLAIRLVQEKKEMFKWQGYPGRELSPHTLRCIQGLGTERWRQQPIRMASPRSLHPACSYPHQQEVVKELLRGCSHMLESCLIKNGLIAPTHHTSDGGTGGSLEPNEAMRGLQSVIHDESQQEVLGRRLSSDGTPARTGQAYRRPRPNGDEGSERKAGPQAHRRPHPRGDEGSEGRAGPPPRPEQEEGSERRRRCIQVKDEEEKEETGENRLASGPPGQMLRCSFCNRPCHILLFPEREEGDGQRFCSPMCHRTHSRTVEAINSFPEEWAKRASQGTARLGKQNCEGITRFIEEYARTSGCVCFDDIMQRMRQDFLLLWWTVAEEQAAAVRGTLSGPPGDQPAELRPKVWEELSPSRKAACSRMRKSGVFGVLECEEIGKLAESHCPQDRACVEFLGLNRAATLCEIFQTLKGQGDGKDMQEASGGTELPNLFKLSEG